MVVSFFPQTSFGPQEVFAQIYMYTCSGGKILTGPKDVSDTLPWSDQPVVGLASTGDCLQLQKKKTVFFQDSRDTWDHLVLCSSKIKYQSNLDV